MKGIILKLAMLAVSAGLLAAPGAFAQIDRFASQPKANVGKYDGKLDDYEDAMKYYKAGQYKQAEGKLNKFLQGAGSHAGGNFLMGLVQVELDELDKARTSFKSALQWDPNMVAPRGWIGAISVVLGDGAGAVEQHEALTKLKADCAGACPKAAEIDQALQRIVDNATAAQQQQAAAKPAG